MRHSLSRVCMSRCVCLWKYFELHQQFSEQCRVGDLTSTRSSPDKSEDERKEKKKKREKGIQNLYNFSRSQPINSRVECECSYKKCVCNLLCFITVRIQKNNFFFLSDKEEKISQDEAYKLALSILNRLCFSAWNAIKRTTSS